MGDLQDKMVYMLTTERNVAEMILLRQQLATARRDVWDGLKVTNDQLSWALKELGPTGTKAEAYIKAAVEYVIWCRAQLKEMR